MLVNIFVLGRSGSGKSTAIRYMIELANLRGYHTTYLRDYSILREMFNRDVEHKRFVPTSFNGFDVTDFSVLDEALGQLENQIQALEQQASNQQEVVLIEFARNDYYHALNKFDSQIVQNAYFLFVESNLETCIERIHQRRNHTSLEEDSHFVSDFIMRSYFNVDDSSHVMQILESQPQNKNHQRIKKVTNDGILEDFKEYVSNFAEAVFNEAAQDTRK